MSVAALHEADLLLAADDARSAHVALARTDVNAFIEYVIKDERTGKPVRQAPIHEAWHELADKHNRLLIWSHIESGKTSQLALARTLFLLGREPNARIAIVSNTHGQAAKIIRGIAQYIEQSAELRQVFPHLKPAKNGPWHAQALMVERPVQARDPSVQACGIHGNILGARIDHLIVDDVLDYENTRTQALRDDLWNWYLATLAGRLTARAKVVVIGTAFHHDDFLFRIAKQGGWSAYRYPVLDDAGAPRWPDRWPLERILAKREELGSIEFSRQMLCVPRDDKTAVFKRDWIEGCLKRGDGKVMASRLGILPSGYRVITGVDLAFQKKDAADWTVFFTIVLHPDGTREVVQVEAGKWHGPEIRAKIIDTHARYHSDLIVVENNAGQDLVLQFTREVSAAPVRPFTTGRNKYDPAVGVESMAVEMSNSKWIIPNRGGVCSPEVQKWIDELLDYRADEHTGDRVMASWMAQRGCHLVSIRGEVGRVDLGWR